MSAQYGGGASPQAKVTVPDLLVAKRAGRKITMMTAYDTAFAKRRSGTVTFACGDAPPPYCALISNLRPGRLVPVPACVNRTPGGYFAGHAA